MISYTKTESSGKGRRFEKPWNDGMLENKVKWECTMVYGNNYDWEMVNVMKTFPPLWL